MPRNPKPYFRKQTKSYYCSLNGKQIPLSKDRETAYQKFYELMAGRDSLSGSFSTLYELSQPYLDWCENNRKPTTYVKHVHYLKSFIDHVGKRLKIAQLRQHHLTKWLANHPTWCETSSNDAVSIVQRMLNWAIEEGYLNSSPIPRIKKPRRHRREIYYTPEQFDQIMAHANGPIADLLNFLWWTGCRPQEARLLEARHIHDDIAIFPVDESKGKKEARMIILIPQAQKIVDRLRKSNQKGPLFRNSIGNPWTKNSIKCRLTRISKKVGFRVIAYGIRHSYATNGLLRSIDPVSLSHLMGHQDSRMISQVYSHISKNINFLRKQAKKAIGLDGNADSAIA